MIDTHDTTMSGLRRRILDGETTLGCWLTLGSSVTAQLAGAAGFDWVLIDLEHGAGTESQALHQLEALGSTPAAPLVRVESPSRLRANRVLDLGAVGVMFPRVETVDEARIAASSLRYPPEGGRGVAGSIRAAGFGADFKRYKEWAADGIVGVVQVETRGILDCLDDVAAVGAIDVLFVGPNDLSASLGVHGQWEHPTYTGALEAVVKACRDHGKAAGILIQHPEVFSRYHDMGFRFVGCGSDSGWVVGGARRTLEALLATLRS
jgi:4-hydroxy-2-oxoheptanedioate aldolase